MATPPILDIASLSTAVSDEQPAGPELREASDKNVARLYFLVRDARKKAIEAERRLRDFASMSDEERKGQPGSPDSADWEAVHRLAIEALTQSKDLWITAWLIEGLTRLHGFAGLRDGVRLAHQLCDRFWPEIHPQLNKEKDPAMRFAQLAGLDGGSNSEGTLIAPLINLPITAADAIGHFSLADYKDASELERKGPEIRRRRIDEGAVTIELFEQAAAETKVEFFEKLIDDLEGASQAFVEFNAFLREKEDEFNALLGEKDANKAGSRQSFVPSSSKIREVLDECLRLCRALIKNVLHKPGARDPGAAATTDTSAGRSDTAGGSLAETRPLVTLNLETRQEAFQTLLRVSDYFRRAEPHSPISYALEQVVRWGRMSLPELLSELVSDRSAREEIFRRAGIPEEPTEK